MSAWSLGVETLYVETHTEEGRTTFGCPSDMGLPYVPTETDGDVDREVKIWTREAVCEIGCVDWTRSIVRLTCRNEGEQI